MHILIAGATGAAGRALLPLLEAHGYTVTGTSSKDMKLSSAVPVRQSWVRRLRLRLRKAALIWALTVVSEILAR